MVFTVMKNRTTPRRIVDKNKLNFHMNRVSSINYLSVTIL
jgi:hypothetical protein